MPRPRRASSAALALARLHRPQTGSVANASPHWLHIKTPLIQFFDLCSLPSRKPISGPKGNQRLRWNPSPPYPRGGDCSRRRWQTTDPKALAIRGTYRLNKNWPMAADVRCQPDAGTLLGGRAMTPGVTEPCSPCGSRLPPYLPFLSPGDLPVASDEGGQRGSGGSVWPHPNYKPRGSCGTAVPQQLPRGTGGVPCARPERPALERDYSDRLARLPMPALICGAVTWSPYGRQPPVESCRHDGPTPMSHIGPRVSRARVDRGGAVETPQVSASIG